jgi:hypothetical protein
LGAVRADGQLAVNDFDPGSIRCYLSVTMNLGEHWCQPRRSNSPKVLRVA